MHKPIKPNPLEGIDGVKFENKATGQETKTTNEVPDSSQKPMNPNTRTLSNFTPVSTVSSLEKTDLIKGTGEEVKPGATVSVHYTGAVAATGVVFQSSKISELTLSLFHYQVL